MWRSELLEETSETLTIQIVVPPNQHPYRVDKFLTETIANISRSKVQTLIDRGLVIRNGALIDKASDKILAGDLVTVYIPKFRPLRVEPEPIPLDIIYEDDYIIAINKAPGMVVHPAAGNRTGTLVNALANYCTTLSTVNGIYRPGIVHRLDKETSGLIIAAKHDAAHNLMARKFEYRDIRKYYQTIVWGKMKEPEGRIVKNIGRNPKDRKTFSATEDRGKHAETRFWLMRDLGFMSLLKIQILTGRTHQIRVHLSDMGQPVLGDSQYGGRTKKLKTLSPLYRRQAVDILGIMTRQALHSYQMEFTHPITKEPMVLTAPLPQDMQDVLDYFSKETVENELTISYLKDE